MCVRAHVFACVCVCVSSPQAPHFLLYFLRGWLFGPATTALSLSIESLASLAAAAHLHIVRAPNLF